MVAIEQNISSNLLDQIERLLEANSLDQIQNLLAGVHPADAADLLEALDPEQRQVVLECIPESDSSAVLSEVDDAVRAQLLGDLDTDKVVALTQDMQTDDFADVLQDIPERTEEILYQLDQERRNHLESVLSYPEDVAGGVMDLEVVTVRSNVTLAAVLRYLRQLGAMPEGTNQLFVTDRNGCLLGRVTLRALLVSNPNKQIGDIMNTDITAIQVDTAVQSVAELFVKWDLLSAPIVDERNRLLGRITVDDIVDYIQAAAQQKFLLASGISNEDTFTPVLPSSKRRAVWLGINLVTAFVVAWIIGVFEPVLSELTALAILLPVVASMGGIAGSQTLTLIIRALSLGQLRSQSMQRMLRKEILVNLINGAFWSLMIAMVTWLWFGNFAISFIIALSVVINSFFAAISGVFIPIVINRLGIDPAIAGGVVLTTITDVVGVIAFLGLATWWIL